MATPFPLLKGTKIWHSQPYPAIEPSRPELNAKGKTVVVSGGGSGIGAAIVKAFAAAGAPRIAIFGRRNNVLQATKAEVERDYPSTKVSTVTADVAVATEVDAAFDEIARNLGKIDVFVSNSGFASTLSTIASSNIDDWWTPMETNVKGAFLVSRAFLRHAAKDANLLNISSGAGHMPAVPLGISAYAASKAAAIKLFEYVALENPGIHVVSVQPGVVQSDMNRKSGLIGQDHGKSRNPLLFCFLHTMAQL
jgi:NAD(P)-dependent dehydrogenase (short-subunit alcohol dehydrogenase family)